MVLFQHNSARCPNPKTTVIDGGSCFPYPNAMNLRQTLWPLLSEGWRNLNGGVALVGRIESEVERHWINRRISSHFVSHFVPRRMELGTPYITNATSTNRIPCLHLNTITPASHSQVQEASPLDQDHFPPCPPPRHQCPFLPPLSGSPSSISDSELLSLLFVLRHFLPVVFVVELFLPVLFCVSPLVLFPRATISLSRWNIDIEKRILLQKSNWSSG